ncbi:hypothetical protein [Heyndrickxia camelliae]|uniref:Uncharacterized protein n=1 Tax=Heyndrickxia camelliae TaxID=1707093 RepID=A0A2N3LCX6_9BACI|nr:hypothetical protein [Heyndrickxia camelliae]PKR82397.1 hypothetical protein CWO92_24730 [Heyndrickxia camelliae]
MVTQLYIHPWYKEDEFSLKKVEPIENYLSKPNGGLWTSSYNPDFGSAWLKSGYVEIKNGIEGYLINVSNDAKVLYVDTLEKAKEVAKKYYLGSFLTTDIFDFEKMSKEYDGINVSNGGLLKISPFWEWNIESTLWFNVSKLEVTETLKVLKFKDKNG